MTLPWDSILEPSGGLNAQAIQDNFQALATVTGADTGGVSIAIRAGLQPVTFTASQTSAVLTISHGLGRTPLVVLGTEVIQNNRVIFATRNYTSTTFDVDGFAVAVALTGLVNVGWIAIG